jgi:hypothetical protein
MRKPAFDVPTLLQIRRGPDGQVPAALISTAYQASRAAPVMLILDTVSPSEVDNLLDPVVAEHGRTHRGLMYAKMQDEAAVLSVAATASRVFAATDEFRAKLASNGIRCEDVAAAEQALRAEAEQQAVPQER